MPAPAQSHPIHLTLANGLRVSLRHAPRLKRCAAALRVAAGSHDVPLAWPGLAHFLEHLFFLGTEQFPAEENLMAFVQRHGGQVNASTRERTTDFFFELPVSTFADGLERLADMLTHPRLTSEDQLREREVLHAEFIAWSQDAAAQQQVALLQGLAADHPLRGFHAGNRDSLPVPRRAFQQALHDFYQRFYQAGQMTLSLTGPQPLAELEALAQRFSDSLASGPLHPQTLPPPLMPGQAQSYQHLDGNHLHQVICCEAPREALEFLCTWLNASAPGGLLAELKTQQLATSLHASVPYDFAGQALLVIDFTVETQETAQIETLLYDWLSFLPTVTGPPCAKSSPCWPLVSSRPRAHWRWPAITAKHCRNLRSQHSRPCSTIAPARVPTRVAACSQQSLPAPPVKEERAGLIRGQTSAHRGLRTFAQDRSRGRKDASALTFSHALADDSDEGALYLQWRFNAPAPELDSTLQALRENAGQAGVELSFEAMGNDWRVRMIGLQQPMPAVLEALAHALKQPQAPAPAPVPMIAIRALLKALPDCCANATGADETPASWSDARWQGLGIGLTATCETAIKAAAARLPGQPAIIGHDVADLAGQHVWHAVKTDTSEAALLLFCPTPSGSLADEAAWRLLGHLLQAPSTNACASSCNWATRSSAASDRSTDKPDCCWVCNRPRRHWKTSSSTCTASCSSCRP
ncbi:pyrroloquinoline quinone biosynthesis protein PqqF [Pseudomonas sp. RTB3]|nr:pyrroloquinoline quinone biosynthesis protein PqqF [Pseudomonas sp. RTB3]